MAEYKPGTFRIPKASDIRARRTSRFEPPITPYPEEEYGPGIEKHFGDINKPIDEGVARNPLAKYIGAWVRPWLGFGTGGVVPYKVAREIVEEQIYKANGVDPKDVPEAELHTVTVDLVRAGHLLITHKPNEFLVKRQEKIAKADYIATAFLSNGKVSNFFRSLKESGTEPNPGLEILTRAADWSNYYTMWHVIRATQQAHGVYREGFVETAGDFLRNPGVQKDMRLIAINHMLPEVANAFGSDHPIDYAVDKYVKRIQGVLHSINPAHISRIKRLNQALPAGVKAVLESKTGLKADEVVSTLDDLVTSDKTPDTIKVAVQELMLGRSSEITKETKLRAEELSDMVNQQLGEFKDRAEEAIQTHPVLEALPFGKYIKEFAVAEFKTMKKLARMGVYVIDLSVAASPLASENAQEAQLYDAYGLIIQSNNEGRPLFGFDKSGKRIDIIDVPAIDTGEGNGSQ